MVVPSLTGEGWQGEPGWGLPRVNHVDAVFAGRGGVGGGDDQADFVAGAQGDGGFQRQAVVQDFGAVGGVRRGAD